ncbi:PucR family transcriptional regulator [Okibacterium endophyticum]
MAPTLRRLLDNRRLGLRTLVTGEERLHDAPLTWVHSSDLDDPTPFLEPGNVLLTTGTQFAVASGFVDGEETDDRSIAYVRRLADAGVTGIGFGTEVVTAGIPGGLVDACERLGLPLFEVPFRVPFIAVARFAADLISEAAHARDSWALGAQRAISRAALRPDAMAAVISELSRQLGRWVALFDAHGRLSYQAGALPESLEPAAVASEVDRLLGKGQRASSSIENAGTALIVQTLGHRAELRGALAVAGTGASDAADQSVLTGVIALAELSLEQGRALDEAAHHLRSTMLAAMLAGRPELAAHTARSLGRALPSEPVQFALARVESPRRDAVLADLAADEPDGRVFFALRGDTIAIAASDGDDRATRLCAANGAHVGISLAMTYAEAAEGIAQAERALADASPASVRRFADLGRQGIAALIGESADADVAHAILAPLIEHDTEKATDLVTSLSAWLEHNGQWDPAARTLGIHRHTLKTRITLVEKLVGLNLDSFESRATLWLALRRRG